MPPLAAHTLPVAVSIVLEELPVLEPEVLPLELVARDFLPALELVVPLRVLELVPVVARVPEPAAQVALQTEFPVQEAVESRLVPGRIQVCGRA